MNPRDDYRYDPRRFVVAADELPLYSGVYTKGEVITEFQAGTARERLIDLGMLVETNYDLSGLGYTA